MKKEDLKPHTHLTNRGSSLTQTKQSSPLPSDRGAPQEQPVLIPRFKFSGADTSQNKREEILETVFNTD